MIGLQPELLYVRKGARLFSTDVSIGGLDLGDFGTNLDVDYLEIPVLLRLSLPLAEPLDVRLLAGPVASLKVDEKLTTTGLIGYSLDTDQVKTTDFGIAAGAAVAIHSGDLAVVGEGRYTFGLTNVSDLSIEDVSLGGDVKNGSIYLMAGVEFLFGGRYGGPTPRPRSGWTGASSRRADRERYAGSPLTSSASTVARSSATSKNPPLTCQRTSSPPGLRTVSVPAGQRGHQRRVMGEHARGSPRCRAPRTYSTLPSNTVRSGVRIASSNWRRHGQCPAPARSRCAPPCSPPRRSRRRSSP